jgi:hypothetical protein
MGNRLPIWQRTTLAGVLTGICAVAVPEVMGVGYDTVNQAMLGELGLWLLFIVVLFKLIATTIGLGLGLPGGLIGPTLVIGAAAGGLLGHLAEMALPGQVASPGFYAMLGMGAMMGATLQAPLAALLAMLELTVNPNIILPGMLAVVASGITSSHLFGHESVFIALLKARGLDYRSDPLAQSLRRIGVTSVANRAFVHASPLVSRETAQKLLHNKPLWIVVDNEDKPEVLLLAADLARFLSSDAEQSDISSDDEQADIDLLQIPANREETASIGQQATLQQALDTMNDKSVDNLCVRRHTTRGKSDIIGVITRQAVESHYRGH